MSGPLRGEDVWVTRRHFPENVIAESAREWLWALDREFCGRHPTVHLQIAAEAVERLSLRVHELGPQTTDTSGHGAAGEPRTGPKSPHETPARVGVPELAEVAESQERASSTGFHPQSPLAAPAESESRERLDPLAATSLAPDSDVDQVWREYWEPIILAAPDGDDRGFGIVLTAPQYDQLKRELFDFHNVLQVVPSVYSHATGGRMSKAGYSDVGQICAVIDEHYIDQFKGDLVDALKGCNALRGCGDLDLIPAREVVEEICSYFNIDPKDLA